MGETSRGNARRLDDRPPTETIRVLHVDDDESFLQVSQQLLTREEGMSVTTLTDPEAALDRLEEFDCIVADYGMPSTDGIEFLEDVRARDEEIPFVLFTGKGSEAIASEAIGAGVTDYLQKKPDADRFAVLAERLRDAVDCRHAEMRAQENDEQVRRVYERTTDAFVAIDEEWRFTYVNQQAVELLGAPPEELLGRTLWDAFPGIVGSRFEEEYQHALAEQETVTFEEYYEPLETWFEVRAFPSESGLSIYFRDVTERKERELRQEAVFDNTYQFTGLIEPDGTLVEANETALEFVDADREDVVGKLLWETPWFQATDETVAIAHRSVEAALDGELYRDELPIEGADGETIIIDYSLRPVTDETGEVALLVPEGRDITELKERQRQLREERAFTESLFEAMPDIFYAFDEEREYLRWNDAFTEVTGHDDGEMADVDPLDLVTDEETDKVAAAIDEVLCGDGTITIESELLTADGERIPYEFAAARLTDDGETLGVVGVGRDISDRRERERRFEAVFNKSFQFTGLMEPDGTLVEANETALEFGGVGREDVVGKLLCETPWFQTGETARRAAREAVKTANRGEFYRDEITVQGDDRTAVIDFSVKPVFNDREEVTLLIPEGRDITELKRRERQLKEKNEQLEKFASIVSHDLKTPLSVADGNLRLAMETGDHEFLEETADAIDRMGELIDELLELAKQGRVVDDPEPVALCSVLSDVETEAAVGTDTEVVVDCPDETTVVAERTRLHSLLSNLVSNAVEHGGGGVTVEVGFDGDTLYVADDGHGIPASERDSVFDPGHSDGGTGFGLAIVETIADAHGWAVTVTESEAGGARFEVSGLETASGG